MIFCEFPLTGLLHSFSWNCRLSVWGQGNIFIDLVELLLAEKGFKVLLPKKVHASSFLLQQSNNNCFAVLGEGCS